jgi:hypothetical protein
MHSIQWARSFLVSSLLVIVLVILASCAPGTPASRRSDVERYLAAMQGWAAVELETGQTIDRIIDTHFVDEAEVQRQIAENHPRLRQHLLRLRSYRPASPDVVAVHRLYLMTWERLDAAYTDIVGGMDEADQPRLARGRQGLLEWRRGLRTVATDLRDLAEAMGAETKRERPE